MNATTEQITTSMRQQSTEDLLAIWQINDRTQWTDSAFDAVSRTLAERGVVVPAQPPHVSIPSYKGVRGWLLFLCISLTILWPMETMASFGAQGEDIYHPNLPMIIDLIIAGCSVYVGVCLWRIRPKAVTKAMVFLWILTGLTCLFIALALFGSGASPGELSKMIPSAFGAFVWTLSWLTYLKSSQRVAATYGN